MSGEQFALPEAIGLLRSIRKARPSQELIALSAADPLNLQGILTSGARIAALTTNRILFVAEFRWRLWQVAKSRGFPMIAFRMGRLKQRSKWGSCARLCGPITNDRCCHYERSRGVPSQYCLSVLRDPSTPLLRFAQDDERLSARHFFTISAFSIMAMPPRSASLPFRVMFLPQYSAS